MARRYITGLLQLQSLTAEAMAASQGPDWELVAAALAQRATVMAEIDALPAPERALSEAEREQAVALLTTLVHQGRQLETLAHAEQAQNRQQLAQHDLARKMLSAYRQTTQHPMTPFARFVDSQR